MSHKITNIVIQTKNQDRVNVSVDGKYRLSLDILQVGDLGLKVGKQLSADELAQLDEESRFGKLYARALEYCLLRPRSVKEVHDYLWRKTQTRRRLVQTKTPYGQRASASEPKLVEIEGYSEAVAERVLTRLQAKGYVDDQKFAKFWVENRSLKKGVSRRKLQSELFSKGVGSDLVDQALEASERDDSAELAKIIAKKRRIYTDDKKFTMYLVRQGFSYEAVKNALESS